MAKAENNHLSWLTMTVTPSVFILVLAAGRSERFGGDKLLTDFRSEPLLRHALRAASEACPGGVVLVTGHRARQVAQAADGFADRCVLNEDFELGMGTSIARGVAACRGEADAILVHLADQPLVTGTHLRTLIERWSGAPDEIVASQYAGRLGPPAMFGSAVFDDLCALRGDRGARDLLGSSDYRVYAVDCAAAALDIDTPADLAACLTAPG